MAQGAARVTQLRPVALGAAAGAHGALLAAVVVASSWRIDKLPPPPLEAHAIASWSARGARPDVPPRLGAETSARRLSAAPARGRPRRDRRHRTRSIAVAPPVLDEAAGGTDGASDGGEAPGRGVSHGDVSGALDGGAPGGSRSPTKPPAIVTPPRPLGRYDRFRIAYTRAAVARRVSGAIVVRLWIDRDGRVARSKLVSGVGHGLDERAVKLALSFAFTPARDASGAAVPTEIEWTFHVAPP
jgi:TonB family protein